MLFRSDGERPSEKATLLLDKTLLEPELDLDRLAILADPFVGHEQVRVRRPCELERRRDLVLRDGLRGRGGARVACRGSRAEVGSSADYERHEER